MATQRCWLWLWVLGACACKPQPLPAASAQPGRGELLFRGSCDASGAVPLEALRFAVADDEDNTLRVYDAHAPGAPLSASDLSLALGLVGKKGVKEADLEAGTRLGDRALWLTSHGRNSQGERKHSRMRFFATSTPQRGEAVQVLGRPYEELLTELLESPQLARFQLGRAARLPPKHEGGLNIEGLTARRDRRSVLIGFRNPLPEGRALCVPLDNPLAVLQGQRPTLGAPELLDLGGLGIRAISLWRDEYLIIAGSATSEPRAPRLFRWDGEHTPVPLTADLADFNPEALVPFEQEQRVLLLSDDGERPVGGTPCKDLRDSSRKGFRGRWVPLLP
jgi:hypothetical protein